MSEYASIVSIYFTLGFGAGMTLSMILLTAQAFRRAVGSAG